MRPPGRHNSKHRLISTTELGSLRRLRFGGSDGVATTCARAGYGPPRSGTVAWCGHGAPLLFKVHLLFSLVIFRNIFRTDPLWQGEGARRWRSLRSAAGVALRSAPGPQLIRTPDSNHRTSNGSILTLLQTSAVCTRMRGSAQGTSGASEQLPARTAVASALLRCDLMPQRSMISVFDRPDL